MTLWSLIQSGGWVMVPLFACSLAVCIIVAERLLAYRNWEAKNEQFVMAFTNHWIKGESDKAKLLAEKSLVEVSEIARELVDAAQQGKTLNFAKVERKRQELTLELKKFLWLLGTIGSAAPFIGLFGTVVGIIESFHNMSQSGAGGFSVVASGISQALVATAGGIIVAVVAVFLYNYFLVRTSKLSFKLKLLTQELLELHGNKN